MPRGRVAVIPGDDPRLRTELVGHLRPMLEPPPSMGTPHWSTAAHRGPNGDLLAGIIGLTTGLWLSIELLWVSEPRRRSGLGRSLVEALEADARARSCRGAQVETTTEASRIFYERVGYTVMMAREESEPGLVRVTLLKRFEKSLRGYSEHACGTGWAPR